MSDTGSSLRSSLIRGAGGSVLVRGASALLAFISTLVLTHTLGAAGYGEYSFAYTTLVALAAVAVVGLDQLAIRDTPAAAVRGRPAELGSLLRGAPLIVFGASLAIVLVAGVVALLAGGNLAAALLIALPLCPLLAWTQLAQGFLYGLERVVSGLAVGTLLRQVAFLAGVAGVYVAIGDDLGPRGAVALQVGAAGLALLGSVVLLLRSLPEDARSARGQAQPRRWLAAGVPMGVSTGAGTLNAALPIAMLGVLSGELEAGVFAAAAQLTLPFALLFTAARNPLAPVISRLWTAGELDRLQRGVTSATRGLFGLTVAIAIPMAFLAEPLLDLFGTGFDEGVWMLRIVLLGVVFNSFFAFNGLVMLMTEHERAGATTALAALVFQAVIGSALIPAFGIEGAAVAYALSVLARNAVNSVQVWRRLGVSTSPFGRR